MEKSIAKTFRERIKLFRGAFRSAVDQDPPLGDANEVFEEGLWIPITKLYRAGEPKNMVRPGLRTPGTRPYLIHFPTLADASLE